MSIKVRTPARFALAAVLTVATATGALAASRGQGQAARDVGPAPQAWGAYAAAPGVPSAAWGAYAWAPQGYGYHGTGYSSLSAPDRHDQAKGGIDY
ncbi:hypothetical protein PQJ75_21030 [Rhodoplanes sp. TEM]|uniref:Uncharacterized protein n=1 Tax=Rhodoplanes tepidamans TaxID=200616 RepID=A0ABT5JFW1_RHOTP|nr:MULTISPECIES: hypothetical protein [Rhodoplanes]MDC7788298.1 hypothetical protein [Rhodoplanes tepidamans]MDC7986222.1 hypothetical protein [Rhodoplanes sp. TEM]MDQ0355649.1 formate hydrogenlyase subunit 3/multisubunit Na+/H+ antiporter MnhD subunit [Rhodoplanes tepidamans]